jgi:predicted transposase/invertase (TIGR01784 family)
LTDLQKPYVDFTFKRIFGSEETKNTVLLPFLNEILRKTEVTPLTTIKLLNPYIDREMLLDKQSILDIRAQGDGGKQINLEIQVATEREGMSKRSLYYWSRMYGWQLRKRQPYGDLKKTIAINILNFNMKELSEEDPFHNVFHLREYTSGKTLCDDLELHFLELPKLEKFPYNTTDRLIKWLFFIKGEPKERWRELKMDNPGIEQAMEALEFLSQNPEARTLYEMREKAKRDEVSAIVSAERRGKAEGREEGREEGKILVARNLLSKGNLSIKEIGEVTGLPISEIEKLKQQFR